MKTGNKKMLFSVSQTQTLWQFRKMEDHMEPTVSILSHHYLISLQPVLLCHFSFFIFFFFYPELSLLTDPELSFSFLCGIRERARPEIRSFACLETRGPRDRTEPRPDLLLLSFSFLFSLLFLFFFKVGFCS